MLKADIKKKVFGHIWKVHESFIARRSAGRLFQAAGPAKEKRNKLIT